MVERTCHECGATLPEGGSCRDHFHALLLRWARPILHARAAAEGERNPA
jgi:hypothetical protein